MTRVNQRREGNEAQASNGSGQPEPGNGSGPVGSDTGGRNVLGKVGQPDTAAEKRLLERRREFHAAMYTPLRVIEGRENEA